MNTHIHQSGLSLIEMLISTAIAAVLLVAMNGILENTLQANQVTQSRNNTIQTAHYAMQRMINSLATTRQVLVPLNDKPSTDLVENIREETVPGSSPPTGSSRASAVLAVTLPMTFDLDGNGVPDADNDQDGRVDEDLPSDTTNDGEPGLRGFDDDGNGVTDFFLSPAGDDDESNLATQSEDPINGLDDDGDGNVDEDPGEDMNGDGQPGISGVDDDGDGTIDEGNPEDDDEDGNDNEDWLDPLVYYLDNGNLIERIAVPWDENSSGSVDGRDYIESVLAENVTHLRFERIAKNTGDRSQRVDILLELTPPNGEPFSITTQVRVGGAL